MVSIAQPDLEQKLTGKIPSPLEGRGVVEDWIFAQVSSLFPIVVG